MNSWDWSAYYLNTDDLNERLVKVKREFGLRKAVSTRSLTGETRTFAEILDSEVEKIVLFYLREQGTLADQLWSLRQEHQDMTGNMNVSLANIELIFGKYRDLAHRILCLLEYLRVNVVGLRQILKKHDMQFDLRM